MATGTTIEWTDATWNPVTGCTKVSPGCKHCYAERMANRLRLMGQANYSNGFNLTLQQHAVDLPLGWRKPKRVFVNSMSDLFHDDVPTAFISRVFEVMANAHWHQFQVLTKRSKRLRELAPDLPWQPNIWMGVSVERADYLFRIDDLRATDAHVKFLSLEPLLGPLDEMDLRSINWAIVGGESGPCARPMPVQWVRGIREQCRQSRVPFFFKQWGGVNKKAAGRELDGEYHDAMPDAQPARQTQLNVIRSSNAGKGQDVCRP